MGDSLPAKTDATRHNRNVKVALVSANVRTLLPWQEDRSYAQNSLCLLRSKVEALEIQFEAARCDLVGIQEGRAKTTAALDGVPLDAEELGLAAALDGGPLDAKKLRLDDGLGDAMDDGLGLLGDASGSLLIGMSGVAPAPTSSEIQCPDAAGAGHPN